MEVFCNGDIPIFEPSNGEKNNWGVTAAIRQQCAMRYLSDALLLETYQKARELKLSEEFIHLIRKEMERRSIKDKRSMTS